MSSVADRADIIWNWFIKRGLNKPAKLSAILAGTRLENSAKTHAALKLIREEYAPAEGLFFPCACPTSGQTYVLTDDPNFVFEAAIHLGLVGTGVGRTQKKHDEFMKRERFRGLASDEKAFIKGRIKFEDAMRAAMEAQDEMARAYLRQHRQNRG